MTREPQERFVAFWPNGDAISYSSLYALAEAKLDGAWSEEPSTVLHLLEDGKTYRDCEDDMAEKVKDIETQRLIDDADEYHHRQAMSGARL